MQSSPPNEPQTDAERDSDHAATQPQSDPPRHTPDREDWELTIRPEREHFNSGAEHIHEHHG